MNLPVNTFVFTAYLKSGAWNKGQLLKVGRGREKVGTTAPTEQPNQLTLLSCRKDLYRFDFCFSEQNQHVFFFCGSSRRSFDT